MILYPPPVTAGAGAALTANNLSDLASAANARANLDVYGRNEARQQSLARQIPPALFFDGATSGMKGYAALGSAGDGLGASGFLKTLLIDFQMPSDSVASVRALGGIGGATNLYTAAKISANVHVFSDNLYVQIMDGAGTGVRHLVFNGLRSEFSGKPVRLGIDWDGLAAPTLYVNGIARASSAENSAGTAPAWTTAFDDDYLVVGIRGATDFFKGRIRKFLVIAGRMDATEHLAWALTGLLPSWAEFRASSPAVQSNTFDNEHAGWGAGGTGASITDFSGYATLASLNNNSTGARIYTSTFPSWAINGRKIRVSFQYRKTGGNGYIGLALNDGVPYASGSNVAGKCWSENMDTSGTWQSRSVELVVSNYSSSFGGISFFGSAATYDLRLLVIYGAGKVVDNELRPGAWIHPDNSGNRAHLVTTPGVTAFGTPPVEIEQPGPDMTADGFVWLDQIITPAGYELADFGVRQSGTATSTITVKETSSGGTAIASAVLSATRTRVKGTISEPFLADGKKLHLSNSAWGGNTVQPYFVFRRSPTA